MFEFDFDFAALGNEDFKEDSVRELIIAPLLKELGFVPKDSKNPCRLEMILSQRETVDFQIGSNKKIEADLTPDYALYVDSTIHCVLDAKAPSEKIDRDSRNYKQALSYAVGFNARFFALCNGHRLVLFRLEGQEILLDVDLENELQEKWNLLRMYLCGEKIASRKRETKSEEWYVKKELPKALLNPRKQAMARYFGCTAYFTRQSWDIVTQNIRNFTNEGDVVLDPFGGSGVTAIEAMMNGRIGIHVDLNPLSVFMAKALSAKVDLGAMYALSEEILSEFENLRPKNEREARKLLRDAMYYPNALDSEFGEVATQKLQDSTLWIPKDEALPKGSDVPSVLQLFSKIQLAELALLRKLIFRRTFHRKIQREMRYALMLAFYNTITMCNLTYHTTEYNKKQKNAGSSGIFFYYRYRIAKEHVLVDTSETFRRKVERIQKGKRELENAPSDSFYQSYFAPLENVIKNFKGAMLSQRQNLDREDSHMQKTNGEKIFQADATDLQEIESESVDFIYTDPPYGAKIPYLDLSTMWNAWLDFPVDSSLKEKECIEKGSLDKTRYEYYDLMKQSLKEMYRVLKWNRWLAFVFQHQDPKLWQILVDSAENIGFEYAGSVRQDNGQESFKKVQNPSTVLSGQIIIYFKKVDNAKVRAKLEVGMNIMEQMFQDIESIIVEHHGANLNEIWNGLIIKAVEGNYIDMIAKKFESFIPAINERFELDKDTKKYHLQENASFSNYEIPIEKRVEYFIRAILGRAKEKGHGVSFNDIVFQVIPLTKNGVQANNKLIKDILGEIAYEEKSSGEWRLKGEETSLFEDW